MTIFELLQTLGFPCAYSHFSKENYPEVPPYIVYLGDGQDTFKADDTIYHSRNRYRIEYYFRDKDEWVEERLESLLLANGYIYSKSEDIFIEDEGVFVIYYYI